MDGLASCVAEVRGAYTEIENEVSRATLEWREHCASIESLLQFNQRLPVLRGQLQSLADSLQTKILVLALSATYSDLMRYGLSGECLSLVKLQQDNECLQVVLNTYNPKIKQLELLECIISFSVSLFAVGDHPALLENLCAIVFTTLKSDFIVLEEDGIDWISISRVMAKFQYISASFVQLWVPSTIRDFLSPIPAWIFNSHATRSGSVREDNIDSAYIDVSRTFKELAGQYDWKQVGLDNDDPTTWSLLLQYYLQQGFRDIFLHSMPHYFLYPIVADGNCFFRSAIKVLWPNCSPDVEAEFSLILRQKMNQISKREKAVSAEERKARETLSEEQASSTSDCKDMLCNFEEEGVTDVETMQKSGVWADHLQVLKLSAFLNRPVWLYRYDDPQLFIDELGHVLPGKAYQLSPSSEEQRSQLLSSCSSVCDPTNKTTEKNESREPLTFLYTPEAHYEALLINTCLTPIELARRCLARLEKMEELSPVEAADMLILSMFALLQESNLVVDVIPDQLDNLWALVKTLKTWSYALSSEFLPTLEKCDEGQLHAILVSRLFSDPTETDGTPVPVHHKGPIADIVRNLERAYDSLNGSDLSESDEGVPPHLYSEHQWSTNTDNSYNGYKRPHPDSDDNNAESTIAKKLRLADGLAKKIIHSHNNNNYHNYNGQFNDEMQIIGSIPPHTTPATAITATTTAFPSAPHSVGDLVRNITFNPFNDSYYETLDLNEPVESLDAGPIREKKEER